MKFRDEEGILNAVEIDRTQMMNVNSEKLKRYGNLLCIIKINITEKYQLFIFYGYQIQRKEIGRVGSSI